MIRPRKNQQGKITSYQVRVWDPNLRKEVTVGSRKTLKEARALERVSRLDRAGGVGTPSTVREYAAGWLQSHPRQAPTMEAYRADIAVFVDAFGSRKMTTIGRKEARAWALQQPRNRVAVVRTFFNDAIDDEVVKSNPFANLRIKQSRGRRDLVVLSEAEVDRLADRAFELYPDQEYGHVLRAMVLFSAWVALRPAELFDVDREPGMAMCVDGKEHPTSYVDLEDGVVHILGQRRKGGERVNHTKNGRVRQVVLADKVVQALERVPLLDGTDSMFYSASGLRFNKPSHFHYWAALRNLDGRPGMDYYELRHFGATELLRRGMSHADVAIHLGHTDGGALVMSTYGHPEEEAARDRIRQAIQNGGGA